MNPPKQAADAGTVHELVHLLNHPPPPPPSRRVFKLTGEAAVKQRQLRAEAAVRNEAKGVRPHPSAAFLLDLVDYECAGQDPL